MVAVCDQLRAVDKSRLREKCGVLSREDLQAVSEALKVVPGC